MLDYKFQTTAVNKMHKNNLGQIILPTGTGKSKIQGRYLSETIAKNSGFGVYVIVTPRILLTNQLMRDVATDLIKDKVQFKRITIHSGKETNFDEEFDIDELKLLYSQDSVITTSAKALIQEVHKARNEDVPVLVCSTYHSVDRIEKALAGYCEVNAMLCDESQYIVNEDFNESISKVKEISNNTFFFTATQKTTASDEGLGHNNLDFYGDV